jgi:iron complex outermembrane receptor protein
MNAFPTAAIEKIEVLRDGAAAQYGSDAIAGVINIITKKSTNELTLNVNVGGNMSKHSNKYNEGGMDGEKFQIDANYGLSIGQKGGFINFTGAIEQRNPTNRSDSMGKQIYTFFDVANRTLGYDAAYAMNPSALTAYVATLDPSLQTTYNNAILNGDTFMDIAAADASEYELNARGLTRDDFRMKVGQSKLESGKFFMTMEVPLSNNDTKVYASGGMSLRNGLAAGFFRRPAYTDGRADVALLPNGFLPHIASTIRDKSLIAGIKGKIGDWTVDFSNTYGKNSFDFTIKNTVNATLGKSSPRQFEAGGFAFSQNTTNIDLSKFYEDTFNGLNVAFGAEYRIENYELNAGEEASWARYDVNGQVVTNTTPVTDLVYSYFGKVVPGGAQVFPGFRPSNEVNQGRNSYAGYLDVELDVSDKVLFGGAIRYEDYSDFGNTFNSKVSTRIKFSDNIALRGAVSTGFRAPDLHQIYFNSTATQFIAGVPYEILTARNGSTLAKALNIPKLKEETAFNASLGFTFNVPDANLKITIDGYMVNVNDRVGLTRNYTPTSDPLVIAAFNAASASKARFFTNGYDTKSKGVDVVIIHKANIGQGKLTNSLSGTFSSTEVTNIKNILGTPILDNRLVGFIESAMPRTKVNLTNNYNIKKWNFMLRNVYFGDVNDPDFLGTPNEVTYGAKIVTDLSLSYKANDTFRLSFGANNILDIYPDEVPASSNYGRQFIFSRRTSQFGFNGRYIFGRITYTLK